MPDADDGVVRHLGPGNDVNVYNVTLSHKKQSTQQSSGLLAQAPVHQPAVNLDKLHHHLGEPHLHSLFHSQRGNKCDRLIWYDDITNVDAAAAAPANTAAASQDDD